MRSVRPFGVAMLCILWAGRAICAPGEVTKFHVKGTNPGGKGGYSGQVEVKETSKQTAMVRWTTGSNNAVTDGFAIRTEHAIGAAYGGKSLYALVVYDLQGGHIHATWAYSSKPEEAGTYDLTGADFDGKCTFPDGTAGGVTFTPGRNGVYKVVWDLPSGHFEGIGLRLNDSLVAASGDPNGDGFGIVAMQPKGADVAGVWTTTQSSGVGNEVWSLPQEPVAQKGSEEVGNGRSVVFDKDTYLLSDTKGGPHDSAALREYLREGENWNGYRKMVAFRMQPVKATASGFAKEMVERTKKNNPNSYVKEVEMKSDSATLILIIVEGEDVEFNLWNFRTTARGLASAQFVMRNKPPFDSMEKFKTEQDKNYDTWLPRIQALGALAEQYIAATAGVTAADLGMAPKEESSPTPDMADAIKADLEKCGNVAQNFMNLQKDGKTVEAVRLISDAAFQKASRDDFRKWLQQSNERLGALQRFVPDTKGTTFGVINGVMTFTLQADAQYEHGEMKEVLRFIRNDKGAIEFVGYDRQPK